MTVGNEIKEIRTDCHFFSTKSGAPRCTILIDFYAADESGKRCGNCPFFKTDAEFKAGWKRRSDDEEEIEAAV